MKLIIINEVDFTANDMLTNKLAVTEHISHYSPQWGFGMPEVDTMTFVGDASKAKDLDVYDIKVYITNRNRRTGAAGYHIVERGKPVAYILPNTKFNRFGVYRKPIGRFPAYYRSGCLEVICHEIAEILGDPLITTFSAPDSQGRNWLREIADPVAGSHYMRVINGVNCVLPDIVLPSFYEVNGVAPYSLGESVKAPFTLYVKGGYGYWRDFMGRFLKI